MRWIEATRTASHNEANEHYDEIIADCDATGDYLPLKLYGKHDRFFLLTRLCKRDDADKPWLYERCREVEQSPDGHLDLWARDHYKSTLITFAGNIQDILNNPEITIGIFSHVRPLAKDFLGQIKMEFETNEELKDLYPDILYRGDSLANWMGLERLGHEQLIRILFGLAEESPRFKMTDRLPFATLRNKVLTHDPSGSDAVDRGDEDSKS